MIRVLLADDHAIVLEGLRALLDGEPDITVAGWTTDGTEVVKLVQQHKARTAWPSRRNRPNRR